MLVMGALTDLWKSERGLVAITLILATTVAWLCHRMTIEQWIEFNKWLSAVYIGSKTITGAVESHAGGKVAVAEANAAAAPPPATAVSSNYSATFVPPATSTPAVP